jgi:N-hydroxyarylamine O-acetyltransferase
MTKLNQLFRNRIGLSESEAISFDMLDQILEKIAYNIPFENTGIIFGNSYKITKESLANKILVRNEGGLCYELNPLLYFFLIENGFHASLVRGMVFNQPSQTWSPTGRTHAAILLSYEKQNYLIDTGFGVKLPLKPVPLNGQAVRSANGEFRMEPTNSGEYRLVMRLNQDNDWNIGYCIDTRHPVRDLTELDEIQEIIRVHSDSAFNKRPLIAMLTNRGSNTLTDSSFTQMANGSAIKEAVDDQSFKEIAKNRFSLNIW